MANIQLSLFGENVRGAFSSNNRLDFRAVLESFADTKIPKCLLLEDGQTPEWFEGVKLMCAGGSWTPSMGENPPLRRKRIFVVADFRGSVPQKFYLNPTNCTHLLTLAERAAVPPAKEIEYLLIKQGGKYQSYVPLEERRTRSAKYQDTQGFVRSFGRSNDPFPTLLAGGPGVFSFWYEGEEKEGFIRYLTPIESERLMSLPGTLDKVRQYRIINSDYARWRALGICDCRSPVQNISWQGLQKS